MARRVIQFPVRNAFAPRSHDSLARDSYDTQSHAHRIVQQVDREIASQAERMASGHSLAFEAARNHRVVTLRPLSRTARFRKQFSILISRLFKRS